MASYSISFNPKRAGALEGKSIGRIEVAAKTEAVAIAALNHEKHDGAESGLPHAAEFVEVTRTAGGHGIREFRQARAAYEMDVLHLDIGRRPLRMLQQKVDPGAAACL